jgi:hypothetical protein
MQGFEIRICHIVGVRRATVSILGSSRKIYPEESQKIHIADAKLPRSAGRINTK